MQQSIIRVTTPDILKKLITESKQAGYLFVDTETAGLNPLKSELRLIQLMPLNSEVQNCYVIDMRDWFIYNLYELSLLFTDESIIKIAHHAKFEIKFLHHNFKPYNSSRFTGWFCTEIASRLSSAGNFLHKHSLEVVVERYLGIKLNKELQKSDWSSSILTAEQIQYAADDVFVLQEVYNKLCMELIAQDQARVALLEMDAIVTIAEAELAGVPLDVDRWKALLDTKVKRRDELRAEVTKTLQRGVNWIVRNPAKIGTRPVKPKKQFKCPIKPKKPLEIDLRFEDVRNSYDHALAAHTQAEAKHQEYIEAFNKEMQAWSQRFVQWESLPDQIIPTINLNSPIQVRKALLNVGVELEDRGTNETELTELLQELKKYAEKNSYQIQIINTLLEYRGAEKSVTSYGENIIEAIGADSRIHPNFRQLGAGQTGRMSCSDPNMQQVPRDPEHRRCITVRPGRKLIIADYPQIELRIMAQLSADRNFVNDFNSGLDMHKQGVVRFYSVPYDQVTKEQRQSAKAVNFHVIYGGGAGSLATRIGKEEQEAQTLLENYFKAYPGNKSFMDRGKAQAQEKGFSRTMAGRLIRFDLEKIKLEPDKRVRKGLLAGIGRNGQNAPIQGTAADMFKRALHLLGLRLYNLDARTINFIHDEIVVECEESIAHDVANIMKISMEEAAKDFLLNVGCDVDVEIGNEWLKT